MRSADAFHRDAQLSCVDVGGVAFVVWFEAPSMAQLAILRRFNHVLHERHPGGYAFLSVVARGVPSFSNEVRAEVVSITRETQGWGFATAHVVLLSGFIGAAVRSFLNTMLLLSRPRQPTRVMGDLEESVDYILEKLPAAHPHRTPSNPPARSVILQAIQAEIQAYLPAT